MTHQEYAWESRDGLLLFGQSWMPENAPRAVIDYVHGFKDHSGRIKTWAGMLVQHGFGVMSVDLRGHGRSGGRRGYADSFSRFIQDVKTLCDQSTSLYGNIPHILYGHSLGGNIVTNYIISDRDLPSAVVISSPWFKLAFKPSLFQKVMGNILRYILPGITVKSGLDAEGLSHDRGIVEAYLHDPLVHDKILPRLFFEIEANGIKASRSIYKINIPMLVMHGSADTITSFRQTADFVMNAGCRTTFKEWPGCFHELHNDFMQKEVFAYLLDWMNRQIPLTP